MLNARLRSIKNARIQLYLANWLTSILRLVKGKNIHKDIAFGIFREHNSTSIEREDNYTKPARNGYPLCEAMDFNETELRNKRRVGICVNHKFAFGIKTRRMNTTRLKCKDNWAKPAHDGHPLREGIDFYKTVPRNKCRAGTCVNRKFASGIKTRKKNSTRLKREDNWAKLARDGHPPREAIDYYKTVLRNKYRASTCVNHKLASGIKTRRMNSTRLKCEDKWAKPARDGHPPHKVLNITKLCRVINAEPVLALIANLPLE